jgi:SAM-dependent methyltransferase
MRHPITDLLPPTALCILLVLVLPGCAIPTQRPEGSEILSGSPTPTASVESVQQESPDAIDRPTDKPYTGSLSVFEDPKREEKLQVNRVMDLLGIREGASVADIGAGSGWFTVRAARRVGNGGLVYAVEINRDYLKHIEERAKRENLANIRTILGKEDNPLLPEKTLDAVLLLKTYHEIAQPIRLLKRTRDAMRPGALLGIIDRNRNADDHGIDREVVIEEADRAGFVLVNEYDFVKPDDVDYFLVFRSK